MPKSKQQLQVENQILYNLSHIIEAFPQYTVSQHFCHFLRKKLESKEAYYWSNELLLQKIEEYYDELKVNLITLKSEEDV